MIYVVAAFLTVTGLFFTYIAVGLVRTNERRRNYQDCDRRIALLRRQMRKKTPR
jgi:hypothetical protein